MSNVTPENPRPPIAAAVITKEGRVLMVRRRMSEGSLSWQFPAGEVEAGESPVDAAGREANEETGVRVHLGTILGQRVHPNTGRTMVYVAFEGVDGEARVVDDDELDACTWATIGELAGLVPYGLFEPVQAYLDKKLPG